MSDYILFQPANPPLNPCFYYLGVRGFDRLVSLFRLTFEGRQRASKEYCGTSGGFRFCYTMCVALRPGAATTTATDLACIIYNNGYPPKPALLPSDIESIPLAFLPTATNVNDNFFCGTITTSTNEVRCLEPCTEIAPITTNPAPAFCYCEIKGSVNDILGSLFYATIGVIDRQVEDRKFCTYKSYTEEGLRCSDSRRLCRPDSRGVFLLPPGEFSCLMYLNGPAGAVGLLSATFWAGVSTLAPTVTGLTVAGSSTAIMCSPPLYCNAGNGCCLVTFTNRGLICPDSC